MQRRAALPVLFAFALASCGGDDDAQRAKTSATAKPKPSVRTVTVMVDGRTLKGHCRGTQRDLPAVMLESGTSANSDQNELATIEEHLAGRTLVCAYDRAGLGVSDAPAKVPRPVTDVVADAGAFFAATKADGPYLLVGQSAGGALVFMYAQAHPDSVAGFVSMNPVPPAKPFLQLARKVETKDEYRGELGFYGGDNDERTDFMASGRMLTDPLPAAMPFVVMFDEDCDGDTEFCHRILPPLTRVTKSLAGVGEQGRFVRAKGAGHAIYETQPRLVDKTIDGVMTQAANH